MEQVAVIVGSKSQWTLHVDDVFDVGDLAAAAFAQQKLLVQIMAKDQVDVEDERENVRSKSVHEWFQRMKTLF